MINPFILLWFFLAGANLYFGKLNHDKKNYPMAYVAFITGGWAFGMITSEIIRVLVT